MERIVFDRGEDEIVEKKSRFIGEIVPISSEEEALSYLESVRKKHYNASHHCFAYVLGDKNQLERASDDGEPSGTAGRPILHVLTGEQIRDAIIVVTRYFGG
ncbi:MAG: YigZ family protein, partial [Lachnospiraceae bacterium]|nr:YigZ family protein [Lachnospiraceae bacterium]